MKIEIIEDDRLLGQALEIFLKKEGYETVLVRSCREARERLDPSVSLLLVDITLPDGDGRAARGERGDGGRGTRGREGAGNRCAELKPPPPRREWSAPGGSPTASRGGTARGRAPTARSGAGRSGPGAGRGAGAARRAGTGGSRRPRARSLWHEYGL